MNILITGGTGFIGKRLAGLLSQNNNVSLLVRSKNESCQHTQILGDLSGKSNFQDAVSNQRVIIHCAARVHIMKDAAEDAEQQYNAVNVEGTINLAKQAAKAGVARFIFLSSIKVNGESTQLAPFTHSDKRNPQDFYGESKSKAEIALISLAKETGMEVVIIRPPLVYGPGVKANFASLIKLVSKGIPLPFGSINKNLRSMVYIDNLIDLIVLAVDHPNASNQIFLVSDDRDLSTKALIDIISKSLHKSGVQLPIPASLFAFLGKVTGRSAIIERLVGSLQLDIEHTKSQLDWTPPFEVEYGIEMTAKHFLEQGK